MVNEGAADPRIATVLGLLEAYRNSDLEAIQQSMAVNVVLDAVGNNPLAGTYEGLGGVLGFIAKSMGVFVTDSVEVQQVEARGDEVQVIVGGDIALLEGDRRPVRIRQRYWFGEEGKVSRIRAEATDDQDEFDRLVERARGV